VKQTWRALKQLRPADLGRDAASGLALTFLAVPQGIAYALIAGLPPLAGLYATAVPAIVGSLTRSSRFVVAGPTNALSLLVGGAVAVRSAELGMPPVQIALQLALLVGVMQVLAALLRLGSIVDFISKPVVLGYISGAAVLIAVGQLPKLTANGPSIAVGLAVAVLVLGIRRIDKRLPAALVALTGVTVAHVLFGLDDQGVAQLSDLSAIASGLPPLTNPGLPDLSLVGLAAAATVLSFVESSSVARTLSDETGEPLDSNREFLGQGLANLAASLTGGYPVSGSPSRSVLNHRMGARSRLAGVFSGVFVIAVLLTAGPLVERIPLSALAGLLLVIAWDLLDWTRIRQVLRSGYGDKAAFSVTLAGTWLLPLDQAIYLGVAISIAMFVRRASLLVVRELRVDASGRLREVSDQDLGTTCPEVKVLHVEGALFFGSAGELRQALDDAADSEARAIVVRLKRAQGLDLTCLDVLSQAARRLRSQDKLLVLVGMRPETMERLERSGVAAIIGPENLFPTRRGWFVAMDEAIGRALSFTGGHSEGCPLGHYLQKRTS